MNFYWFVVILFDNIFFNNLKLSNRKIKNIFTVGFNEIKYKNFEVCLRTLFPTFWLYFQNQKKKTNPNPYYLSPHHRNARFVIYIYSFRVTKNKNLNQIFNFQKEQKRKKTKIEVILFSLVDATDKKKEGKKPTTTTTMMTIYYNDNNNNDN